jgi:hypothetical protein
MNTERKQIYLFLAILMLALSALFFFACGNLGSGASREDVATTTSFTDDGLGLSFSYDDSERGYMLSEMHPGGPVSLAYITLMRREDLAAMSATDTPREGPPVITVAIYKNPSKQQPRNWAAAHDEYSNWSLRVGEEKETVVGGANAIRYSSDGLYMTDNVIVAHGGRIYVLSGSYIDASDPIHADLGKLVDSLVFVPTPEEKKAITPAL